MSDRQPTGRSHTSGDLRADGGQTRTPFTDSPVVTTTVRLLSPFVLTLGLFTLFHGTSSVGGGFQGGVVAAATVITVAFALGLSPTADWIDARVLGALVDHHRPIRAGGVRLTLIGIPRLGRRVITPIDNQTAGAEGEDGERGRQAADDEGGRHREQLGRH